jgi:GxxExxY protein
MTAKARGNGMAQDPRALHEELTGTIIGACFEVAKELGRGFLESVYQHALAVSVRERGLQVVTEAPVRVLFHGQCVGNFFADLLVEDKVIVELKVAKELISEHQAQLINYLNASDLEVGLLVNFGPSKIEHKRCWRSRPIPPESPAQS